MSKEESIVGRELAGLRLTELIGAGGMATVYRGENPLDKEEVRAIKVLHPHWRKMKSFASALSTWRQKIFGV